MNKEQQKSVIRAMRIVQRNNCLLSREKKVEVGDITIIIHDVKKKDGRLSTFYSVARKGKEPRMSTCENVSILKGYKGLVKNMIIKLENEGYLK